MENNNSNLAKLADGLSHDVTMMENSFMHLAVPGKLILVTVEFELPN